MFVCYFDKNQITFKIIHHVTACVLAIALCIKEGKSAVFIVHSQHFLPPTGEHYLGEEIPTLSARIEEKQKSRGEANR